MSVEYKILWVDDTPDWVSSIEADVHDEAQELGLNCVVKKVENGSDAMKSCLEEGYDLLLCDYNLPGDNGDAIIASVRPFFSMADMVFYSEEPPTNHSLGDDVMACDRQSVMATIVDIMRGAKRRLGDLRAMRGGVIAAAIDLENLISDLIVQCGGGGEGSEILENKIIGKGFLDFKKKADILNSIIKDRMALSDKGVREELKSLKLIAATFDKEVVNQRNILAHSVSVRSLNGVSTMKNVNKGGDLIFDDNWTNSIRVNLRKHRRNYHQISKLL